ncbi:hypothetical protein BOQ62_06370 [Chryseobacterium sp. CH21]|uniref:DUF4279 domain-containing protein n=1 Tax=Chryseobacterium sp. CH21 TaxID=713556 RepID=UPI00100A9895|nr:DUF4279 domain-containing protein [Chryseobacterium sp. CH21]RXM40328.1 hypothetical protein BOQ62_06370 [Chryseobacterium sp. CH21]
MVKNDLNLRFNIWDYEDINDSEITESLNLIPYKIYSKGKQINPNSSKLSKRNGWIYGPSYGNEESFEEQMNKILDILEPKIPILKEYAKKYYCEFSCALFLNNREESAPWIHFDKRYNAFIREVDAEFDFDIYCPSLEE